jgi:hypothetical protein
MAKDIRTWLIGYDKVRITDEHEAEAKRAESHKSPGTIRSWVLGRLGRKGPTNADFEVKRGTYRHQRSTHRPNGN